MDRLETLFQFLKEDPDDAFTLFAIASEYRKRGDIDMSLTYFRRLVAEQPDYVGTYYHLGKVLEEKGLRLDAIQVYEQGIDVAAKQRDPHARAELQDALMSAKGIGWDD
jgi:tetratricopeptide (TPR) repeat protein